MTIILPGHGQTNKQLSCGFAPSVIFITIALFSKFSSIQKDGRLERGSSSVSTNATKKAANDSTATIINTEPEIKVSRNHYHIASVFQSQNQRNLSFLKSQCKDLRKVGTPTEPKCPV